MLVGRGMPAETIGTSVVVKQSNSAIALPAASKLSYMWELFRIRMRDVVRPPDHADLFRDFEEYDQLMRRYAGLPLAQAKVLEIGYGARPIRIKALHSMGVDIRGIDLDAPLLGLHSIGRLYRKNGFQRALKSLVRHYCFDSLETRGLVQALKRRGFRYSVDPNIFEVGDAGDPSRQATTAAGSLDLIYSEDVFEHLPAASFAGVLRNMAHWLRDGGMALIRPHIYSGIAGGHLPEWYPYTLRQEMHRRSAPWEHLRQRRFKADTYLNELRLEQYREAFGQYFKIEEEIPRNLGADFLSEEIQSELSEYSREELLANKHLFVLRKR